MSHEILYTSAPQGLKPGSRGFCTVVSTAGMAKNLAERLESLSGYRHAFLPHSVHASLNPVNFSHLIVTVGGRQYHVLSRVADAGLDYTQRSNKLAHHVALTAEELPECGPAALLQSPGFCQTAWDGRTRILPAGRQPCGAAGVEQDENGRPIRPAASPGKGLHPDGPCLAWEQVAGDAGWAGVLAGSALDPQAAPVSIIFTPETPTLALVAEALALLPPERRWQVTFSTYFTRLPAGVDCQWRFLLADSPEARAVRRNPHARRIDLCRPLGSPPPGQFVDAARTGMTGGVADLDRREPSAEHSGGPSPARPQPPGGSEVPELPERGRPVPAQVLAPETYRLVPRPPLRRDPFLVGTTDRRRFPALGRRGRSRRRVVFITAAGCVLVAATVLGAWFFWFGRGPNPAKPGGGNTARLSDGHVRLPALVVDTDPPDHEAAPQTRSAMVSPQQEQVAGRSNTAPVDPASRPQESATTSHHQASPSRRPSSEEPRGSSRPAEPSRIDPLAEIRRCNGRLQLPRRDSGFAAEPARAELVSLPLPDGAACALAIVGSEQLLPAGRRFELTAKPSADGAPRAWTAALTTSNAIGRDAEVGVFLVDRGSLWFQWSHPTRAENLPALAAYLEFCLLRVEVEGQSELCTLSQPREVLPAALNLSARRESVELPLPVDLDPGLLKLDLAVAEFPEGHETSGTTGLQVGQSGRVRLYGPGPRQELDRELLGVEVKFEVAGKRLQLVQDISFREDTGGSFMARPATQVPRLWFDELGKEADRRSGELDKRRKELDRQLASATRKLNHEVEARKTMEAERPPLPSDAADVAERRGYEAKLAAFEKKVQPFQQREDEAARQVADLEAAVQELQRHADELKGVQELARQRLGLFQRLEADARIHFRLYVEIENCRVELLRTQGAPFPES